MKQHFHFAARTLLSLCSSGEHKGKSDPEARAPEAASIFIYQATGVALIAGPACCASGSVNEHAFSITPRITSDYSE